MLLVFVCLLKLSYDTALYTHFLPRDKLFQYYPQWNLDENLFIDLVP